MASEPEHGLGYDIALNLVRAAIDRCLAHVEIASGGAGGIVGSDIFVVPEAVLVRKAIIPDRLEGELGDALLNFGSTNLEDRTLWTRYLPFGFSGERPQLGEFECRK